jgi:hypothetical protein
VYQVLKVVMEEDVVEGKTQNILECNFECKKLHFQYFSSQLNQSPSIKNNITVSYFFKSSHGKFINSFAFVSQLQKFFIELIKFDILFQSYSKFIIL